MQQRPQGPLLARENEAGALLSHLRSGPGGPSTLVIEGPAGSGKTALLTHVLRSLDLPGSAVAKAVAREGDRTRPYALLEQWGLTPEPEEPPERVARAILETWAPAPPQVIVLESAHDAAPLDLDAVQSAALLLPGSPKLVLLARPDGRIDLPDAARLTLPALDIASAGRLVRGYVAAPTAGAIRAAHTLTGGIPGDLLDLAREAPPLAWLQGSPSFGATTRHRHDAAALRDLVSAPAWALLETLAVLDAPGDVTDVTLLGRVAQLEPDRAEEVLDAIQRLPGAPLLRPIAGRTGMLYAFAHPMTATAIRDLAGPGRIRALHRRAAVATDSPDVRLAHLVAASTGPDPDLAAAVAAHAAHQGTAGAWGQAARAYVDAARVAATDAERADHLVAAVDAFVGAGELPAAEDLVPEVQSLPRTARTEAGLGYLSILRGRSADASALLTRAHEAAERAAQTSGPQASAAAHDGPDDGELRALVCTRWVLHELAAVDAPALLDWADRAIALAGPDSPYAREAGAIRCLGLGALGRWEEARRQSEAAIAHADTPAQLQRALLGRGWLDLLMDDPLAARSHLESAVPTAYSLGSARISLWAHGWLARTLFVLGHWSECLAVTRTAERRLETSGHELLRPLVHWPAAAVHAMRGETREAHRHAAAGAAGDHDYLAMRLPAALAQAAVAEADADYTGVLRALAPIAADLGGDPARDSGFWPWADVYVNALVMTNRLGEAQELLDVSLEAARSRGHRSGLARAQIAAGRLHGARGDLDAAVAAFDSAHDLLAPLPLPVDAARLAFVRGQTLRRAGKRREADEVMRAAREAYTRLGAGRYVARCDRELKASGLERTQAAGIGALTPQEAAVAELVAGGATNKEAAGELFVTVKTVQYHLTRIHAKLGVRSRAELAARYAAAPPPD